MRRIAPISDKKIVAERAIESKKTPASLPIIQRGSNKEDKNAASMKLKKNEILIEMHNA